MKEWRKLIHNNGSVGRIISIPKELINDAGFEDEDEIEGKWKLWAKQERIIILELRDAEKNVSG